MTFAGCTSSDLYQSIEKSIIIKNYKTIYKTDNMQREKNVLHGPKLKTTEVSNVCFGALLWDRLKLHSSRVAQVIRFEIFLNL